MRFVPKFLLVWILNFVMVPIYAITEDFVRVTKSCPKGPSAFGEILILSDQDSVYPYALCRGREYSFVQISAGVYRLRFRHSGDPNENCLSTLVFQENYYAVQVNIPIQENLVTSKTETEIVRCPISLHAPSEMTISNREDLIFKSKESAPVQKQSNMADLKLLSDTMMKPEEPEAVLMSLQVHSIDNATNSAQVQIYSLMKNPRLEINGVLPLECHMLANSEVQFIIIDNGCGNGTYLPMHTGFEVQGIVSWSPVFSFPLQHDGSMFVNCTFGVCKNKCDGSSCHQNNIEILRKYTASTAVSLTSVHEDVRQLMADSKDVGQQVTTGYPPLQNNPVENTTGTPTSYTAAVNVPLIIALSVFIPIVLILLIAVCWYRSKVNSGAYRVRDREN